MLTLSQYPFTQIKGKKKSEAAGDRGLGGWKVTSDLLCKDVTWGAREPCEGQVPTWAPDRRSSRGALGVLSRPLDVFC